MIDWTARIIELEEAKSAMTAAKKQIKAEEERKALLQARTRIAERTADIEHDFATRLARANSEGLPQSLIRKEVLRTNDWDTWVKWRDLAEIEPERIRVADAKKAAETDRKGMAWDTDAQTLTVTRNSRGDALSTPLVYDLRTVRRDAVNRWTATADDSDYELRVMREDEDFGFVKALHAELQAGIDAGKIRVGD